MRNILIILLLSAFPFISAFAQGVVDKSTADFLRGFNEEKIKPAHIDTSYWASRREIRFTMNAHSVSNNWYQNDNRSSITAQALIKWEEIYKREYTNWYNVLQFDLGFRWEDAGKLSSNARNLSVAANNLRLESQYGVRLIRRIELAANAKLVTQILPSYANNTSENPNKSFMSPGYLDIGLGATYKYNNKVISKFEASFFPINNNTTFVLDQRLADLGTAGVKPAEKDENGNIIKHGQSTKIVWGFRLQAELKMYIDRKKDFRFENYFSLFMDYITNPGAGQITNTARFIFPIVKDRLSIDFVNNLRYFDSEKTTRYKWVINDEGKEVKVATVNGPTIQMLNDINLALTFKF